MEEVKIKKSYLKFGIIAIIVIAGFLVVPKFTGNSISEVSPPVKTSEIILQTSEGDSVVLSQFKGNVVVLQAMASWCPSCKLQAQQIKPLYEKYKYSGLEVISLDIQPERSNLDDLKEFKKTHGGDWYFGFYPEFISQYGVRSLDSTVVINRKGEIVYQDDTITTTEKLEEVLVPLLK
ncbi:MAG: TlpA family protein disulfide reductase [Candidatus Nanoarchaeia archaeon]